MAFLTIEERKKYRKSIEHLHTFNNKLEVALRKRQEIPLPIRKKVFELTNCTDMGEAFDALLEIKEYTQEQYLSQIKEMAPTSLSAFAEYMNPDEPPAKHHEFLIDHLEAIEQGDLQRMLLSMPPGHAKPLTLDSPVMLQDGTYKLLGDIKVGDEVVTHKQRSRPVTAVHEQGELPVYTIETKAKRKIKCAADHPFLTSRGWINAGDLDNRDVLIPSTIATNDEEHTIDEYELAGSLILSGQLLQDDIDMDSINIYYDHNCIQSGEYLIKVCAKNGIHADFAYLGRKGNNPNRVYIPKEGNEKLQQLGVFDAIQNDRVPEWVFTGSPEQIYSFISATWKTIFSERRRGKWPEHHRARGILFQTEGLAEDYERLMWRLNIHAAKAPYKFVARSEAKGYSMYANMQVQFNYSLFLPSYEAGKFSYVLDGIAHDLKNLPRNEWRFFKGDQVVKVTKTKKKEKMRCLTVEEDSSFTVYGVVVHNSTYASHLFPAWYFGRNPKKRYLQAGHTQKFCEDELGKKVRSNIKSERYHEIFPEIKIAYDTSAAATWALEKYNGKYMVRAVGQGIAGLRGHIGGVDDPYPSYRDAESPVYRKQVIDWFKSDFSTRLLPNSPLFVVATRWHPDDLCGILEEESKLGKIIPYTVINLPVFCVDPEKDPLNRQFGERLWSFFPEELILNFKNSMSNKQFSSLYLGNPIPESGNMLDPEWIRYYEVLPKGPRSVTISADTANKANERNDFTVITVWYQYGTEHYLVDVIRRRMEFNEIKSTIELHARKHKADRIIVEDAGTGTQYHTFATKTEHVPPCPVIAIKPHGSSKEFRFDASLPQWEAGNVFLPKHADWLSLYETELLNFPAVSHDDQVDSTSQYLIYRRPKPTFGSVKMGSTTNAARSKSFKQDETVTVRPGSVDMTEAEDAE